MVSVEMYFSCYGERLLLLYYEMPTMPIYL